MFYQQHVNQRPFRDTKSKKSETPIIHSAITTGLITVVGATDTQVDIDNKANDS